MIRVSLSDGVLRDRTELDQRIRDILRVNREVLGLQLPAGLPENDITSSFADLIRQAHQRTGQRAVVLIDEYDKPILDNITNSAAALEMREGLKNLYSVLKGSDEHLKFVFLTGVSKFSDLTDITLDARYSHICGYTDADVDTMFAPELPGLDRDQIRQWYTATTGWASAFTTLLTCCCYLTSANSGPIGLKPARPHFWSSYWPHASNSPLT